MAGTTVIRTLLGAIGVALILAGLALAFDRGGFLFLGPGVLMVVGGGLLVIAAVIEVTRYRSLAAERRRLDPGPGGGEAAVLEPRFQRTEEVFVDPTTRLRMRVYMDPLTGERRYVAEG